MVLHHLHNAVGFLNQNTMFAGIMLLVLNVGSRFIVHELSSIEEEYKQNILLRRFAIFAVCFVGTKDLLTSIILTAGFVILSGGLFRGKGESSREGMTTGEAAVVASTDVNFGAMNDPAPPLFSNGKTSQ
jgi:hypothetical protein